MKLNINIEIELTDIEAKALKTIYSEDRRKKCNLYMNLPEFSNSLTSQLKEAKSRNNLWAPIVKGLISKSIINIDNIGNFSLSEFGVKVVDELDRDIKISKILDGK